MEHEKIKKKRAQLRLNLFLAMLLLLGSAVFSSVYGVVFLVNEWRLGYIVIGVASCIGAFALDFLLIWLFFKIYRRLHVKLVEVESHLPVVVSQ